MSIPPEAAAIVQSLFDAHFTGLVRFAARRVGDRHLAEDLAVECFVRALRHRDPTSIGSGWLYRTARNLVGDSYRRRDREVRLIEELSKTVADTSPPHDAELLGPLAKLSAGDRELLMLLYLDRLPVADVATVLGLSVTTVWKRASRAKSRLRESVAGTGSEPTEGSVITLAMD